VLGNNNKSFVVIVQGGIVAEEVEIAEVAWKIEGVVVVEQNVVVVRKTAQNLVQIEMIVVVEIVVVVVVEIVVLVEELVLDMVVDMV